jgi:hypothetical protein
VTECNRQALLFSSLGRQEVRADFAGGTLTSDGGGLLLREVDRRLGLVDALTNCLSDPRHPAKVIHEQRTMLAQRIFGLALGYEDLNDHNELRRDPLFSVLADKPPKPDEPLASSPTLCRLENHVERKALARMSAVLVEQFIASFGTPPDELVLDFDPTDLPVHGQQELRFFHGFYGHYCFLPLYVFCGSQLLVAYLRPSNIDAPLHSRAILKLLVARLRQAWPKVRIVLRADSSFARWRLLRWCEKNSVFYVVGLARNQVLERMAAPFMAAAQAEYERTQQKVRNFHEFDYAAGTWDHPRRVIVKAERLEQGPNLRLRADQSGRVTGHDLRPALHTAGRHGESHQRAAAHVVRYAGFLSCLRRQSVPAAAQRGGLRADRAPAAYGVKRHRVGRRPGGHNSPEALQGRGPPGDQRTPCGAASVERLPVTATLPPPRGPARRSPTPSPHPHLIP